MFTRSNCSPKLLLQTNREKKNFYIFVTVKTYTGVLNYKYFYGYEKLMIRKNKIVKSYCLYHSKITILSIDFFIFNNFISNLKKF